MKKLKKVYSFSEKISKLYYQKLRKEWLVHPKLKEWIKEYKDPEKAYCNYCKCDITAKFGSTIKNKPIPFKPVSYKIQQQEATLCMYIAVHSSIAAVDHLADLCKDRFDSHSVRLHRTKCTNIIKNVLAPHFNNELQNDIGDGHFSILIDESTDVSFTKILGEYYAEVKNIFFSISKTAGSAIDNRRHEIYFRTLRYDVLWNCNLHLLHPNIII